MKRRYRTFDECLLEDLRDPKEAALFLTACFEEQDPAVILDGLSLIAKARGLSKTAKRASVSRMGLYKMLSKDGNPGFKSFLRVLNATGLQMTFKPA